ncbi:hypothetical protein ACWGI8_28055, partial [Streptomyces sp. NPDC054841]
MANTSTRGRVVGSPARRSMTAAARAAAKRAERAVPGEDAPGKGPDPLGVVAGRTLRAEDPEPESAEPDWEAPDWEEPEPAVPRVAAALEEPEEPGEPG